MWFVSRKIITNEIHSIVLYIKSTAYKQSIHNYIIYKKYYYIIMYSNGFKYKPISKASLPNQVTHAGHIHCSRSWLHNTD